MLEGESDISEPLTYNPPPGNVIGTPPFPGTARCWRKNPTTGISQYYPVSNPICTTPFTVSGGKMRSSRRSSKKNSSPSRMSRRSTRRRSTRKSGRKSRRSTRRSRK